MTQIYDADEWPGPPPTIELTLDIREIRFADGHPSVWRWTISRSGGTIAESSRPYPSEDAASRDLDRITELLCFESIGGKLDREHV